MSKKEILKQLKPYIRSEYRSVGKGCNHESYILDRDFKYIVDILQCASQEDKRRIEELENGLRAVLDIQYKLDYNPNLEGYFDSAKQLLNLK